MGDSDENSEPKMTFVDPRTDPDFFSAQADEDPRHQQRQPPRASDNTEMPLREVLTVAAAFMALLFVLLSLFENYTVNHQSDPGTGRRPGVIESIISAPGNAPFRAPWR